MTPRSLQEITSELATLRAEVATLKRRRRRGHAARRLLVIMVAAALVALVPLTVFAGSAFLDLDPNSPHNDNIAAIQAAGITKGCDPPAFAHYCPKDPVTREEMASFLARTAGLGTNPPVANAQLLQGYAPSGLVRAARGRQFTNFTSLPHGGASAPPVALTELTLDAPGPGFVLLNGTFNASREVGNGFAPIEYQIQDFTGSEASPPQTFTLGPGVNNLAGSATTVLAVPAAGEHVYALTVRNMSSDNNAFGLGGEITALFVPFGPTGGTTP